MKKLVLILSIALIFTGCSELDDFFDARHDAPLTKTGDGDGDGTGTGTGTGTGQGEIDFAMVKRVVLQDNCISCHTGRHRVYEDYNIVRASAAAILERMTTTNNSQLMPRGGPRLDDKTIAVFEQWVNNGAPEFVKDPDGGGNGGNGGGTDPEPEAQIGFAQIKAEVLEPNNCIACHSQFNDYATVRRGIGSIVGFINSGEMPFPTVKGGTSTPVPQAARDLLTKWISQGTPEFAFAEAEELPDIEIKPTWISLRNHVFGPKCVACHNSFGNRGGGESLDTYTNFQAWVKKAQDKFDKLTEEQKADPFEPKPLVITDPDNPEFGGLHTVITGDPDDPFAFPTPMPFNNPFDDVEVEFKRITPDEVKIIEDWIKAGLPFGQEN